MHGVITTRHVQRDMRLIAEADRVANAVGGGGSHGTGVAHMRLSTQLELQTILCTEYRYVPQPTACNPKPTIPIKGIHTSP